MSYQMRKIDVGSKIVFEPDKRLLRHRHSLKVMVLGVSASACFETMLKNPGKIFSQEELLDTGWRASGLEVTVSSLRVAMNQIRRALLQLDEAKDISIITVPREGYKLLIPLTVVSENSKDSINSTLPEENPAPDESVMVKNPENIEESKNLRFLIKNHKLRLLSVSSILTIVLLMFFSYMAHDKPTPVNYTVLSNSLFASPKGTTIYYDSKNEPDLKKIETTIKLWTNDTHDVKTYQHLYINVGVSRYHYGLFACKKPVEEPKNECKAYVFRKN
jgi:DNA-binding winged helix-turn-helix (wHTH) protein